MTDGGEPSIQASYLEARLAATRYSVGRLSHELRGAFVPALLAAERLQGHDDAAVRRAADIILRAVDRATTLLSETVRDMRKSLDEQPAPHGIDLREALDQRAAPGLVNDVPDGAVVWANETALARAVDAALSLALPGHRVRVTAVLDGGTWAIGFHAPASSTPARAGTEIAREWLRSFGADLTETDAGLLFHLRAA